MSDVGVSMKFRYKECLKNHAAAIGGHAVDGCGEFMAAGEEGSLEALKCAACNCHRNFHRKVSEGDGFHRLRQQQHNYSADHHGANEHVGCLRISSISREDPDGISNPSSGGGSRKRFRTKIMKDQKDKMLELSEKLGWRIQKHDEAMVQHFCSEIGVKRRVLKVWMHNNKYTLGKKQSKASSLTI